MSDGTVQYDDIRIEITGRCNLKCLTCHAADRNDPVAIKKELTTEEVLAIIAEAQGLGIREFELIGGEPFLHKDLFQIIDACDGTVNICTNGHFFTEKNLSLLAERKKIRDFCISMDGTESHDRIRVGSSYRKVLDGIAQLKRALPWARVLVQTTCNGQNQDDLMSLYEALFPEEVRPHTWSLNLFWKAGRGIEHFDTLCVRDMKAMMERFRAIILRHRKDGRPFILNIYNTYNSLIADQDHEEYEEYGAMDLTSHPCAYHLGKPCIRSDGSVEFCNSLHAVSVNIREAGSLKNALQSQAFRDFYAFRVGDIRHCPICRYLNICGGGCRGEALTHLKDMRLPDPIACRMMELVESEIMPALSEQEQAKYRKLIRGDLNFPPKPGTL